MIFICCDNTRVHYIHIISLFMTLAYVCTYTWKFTQSDVLSSQRKSATFLRNVAYLRIFSSMEDNSILIPHHSPPSACTYHMRYSYMQL